MTVQHVPDMPRPATQRRPLFGVRGPAEELPAGSPTGKRAADILAAEQLSELRAMNATTTAYWGRVAGMLTNDVLDVGSQVFIAGAVSVSRQFHVAAGCVVVDNQGSNVMYVNPSMAAISAPGPQSTPVPPGAQRLVNLASREFTISGTAGDTVAWQAFTRGGVPGGTLGSVNGGTP